MKPIDFFETNKEKIKETAIYLSKSSEKTVDEIFNSLRQDFLTNNGTCHDETLSSCSNFFVAKSIKEFRNLDFENFVIFVFYNNNLFEIFKCVGNQFASAVDFNKILNVLTALKIKMLYCKNIVIYVFHNHPFLYRAAPSQNDCEVFEQFIELVNKMNSLDPFSQICIADFGIATPFDYWSFEQNN